MAFALAGLVVCCLFAASAAATSPEDYRSVLSATLQAAESAAKINPPLSSLAADRALALHIQELESIGTVGSLDQAIVVDNRALIAGLRSNRDQGLKATQGLRALLNAIDAAALRSDKPHEAEARAALRTVLDRPEFRLAARHPLEIALESLRTRLFQWLAGLFTIPKIDLPFVPPDVAEQVLRVVLYVVMCAALAFTIVFLFVARRSARRNLAPHAALTLTGSHRQFDSPRAARLAADTAAHDLDFRNAVHYLYLWAVLQLAEQSRLRFDRSLTNRELLQALEAAPRGRPYPRRGSCLREDMVRPLGLHCLRLCRVVEHARPHRSGATVKIPREIVLLLGLFLVLSVAALVLRPDRDQQRAPALSSHFSDPDGTLGLYLWLQGLGYQVDRLEYREFHPDTRLQTIFLLHPSDDFSPNELTDLRKWVEGGGTLIVSGTEDPSSPPVDGRRLLGGDRAVSAVLSKFDLSLRPFAAPVSYAQPAQPLLIHPAVSSVRVDTQSYISGTNMIPLLSGSEEAVAAEVTVGQGKVYVLASNYALSNEGLATADNAALVLNWLPFPPQGIIALDEIHHGLVEQHSLWPVLLREPWGRASLYVLAIILVYLIVTGRRFGKSVVPVLEGRRAAGEYVVSVADLLRRGDKKNWALAHYDRALRRQLAATFGWEPDLSSEEVAKRLNELRHLARGIDGANVARLMQRLGGRSRLSEKQLVELAMETDRVINACRGGS